jgi:hypothetical protein
MIAALQQSLAAQKAAEEEAKRKVNSWGFEALQLSLILFYEFASFF